MIEPSLEVQLQRSSAMALRNPRTAAKVKAGILKLRDKLVSWTFIFCTLLMLASVVRMWSHWFEIAAMLGFDRASGVLSAVTGAALVSERDELCASAGSPRRITICSPDISRRAAGNNPPQSKHLVAEATDDVRAVHVSFVLSEEVLKALATCDNFFRLARGHLSEVRERSIQGGRILHF